MDYYTDSQKSRKDRSEGNGLAGMATRKRDSDKHRLKTVVDNPMETEDILTDSNVDPVTHAKESSRFGLLAETKPAPKKVLRHKSRGKAELESSAIVNELETINNQHFATEPVTRSKAEGGDTLEAGTDSNFKKKRRLIKAARPAPLECIPENNFEGVKPTTERKHTATYSASKKNSRETILQQEFRDMKKEQNLNILESIQRQEARAEERKSNRLDQIMEKVKYQRNQYGSKRAKTGVLESVGENRVSSSLSKPESGVDQYSKIQSLSVFERENSRDESIGGSTNQFGTSLSGANSNLQSINLTAKFKSNKIDFDSIKRTKPKLEEVHPTAKMSIYLKQKPTDMPKIAFEISQLRERKVLVDLAESTCKPPKKRSASFSVDVARYYSEF